MANKPVYSPHAGYNQPKPTIVKTPVKVIAPKKKS